MKRWIIFISVFILLIISVFASYLYFRRTEFTALVLSRALETSVKIKSLDFTRGGVVVKQLKIKNPSGCSDDTAIAVERIDVQLNWTNTFKAISGIGAKNILVDQIRITAPEVHLELLSAFGDDNNLKRLVSTTEKPTPEPSSRKFEINKLTLTDITVTVKHPAFGTTLQPSPIAKIEIDRLGSDNPKGVREACFTIISKLMGTLLKEINLKNLTSSPVEEVIEKVPGGEKVGKLLDALLQDKSDKK